MIVINTTAITSREEAHEVIRKALELPDFYGANLDALWDVLSEQESLPITLIGRFDGVPEGYGELLFDVFDEAHENGYIDLTTLLD